MAPLTIHRELHDGARYDLSAAAPGVTALAVCDADGDTACLALDRAALRRLLEDLELVAGLRPTPSVVPLETALAGSARFLFERLVELDKQNPAAADRLAAAIAAHLRSWRPLALAVGAVP